MSIDDMIARLELKCTAREMEFPLEVLEDELLTAIDTVNNRRGFLPSNEMFIEQKYQETAIKLALFALTKFGAEGELTHSETGVSRTYESSDYPRSLLNTIIPLAKGL